jgi:hypothetical protein
LDRASPSLVLLVCAHHPWSPIVLWQAAGDVYELKRVRGARRVGNSWQYLCRWKNYGAEDDTWEPKGELT